MTGRHYSIDGERYPSVTTILTALANEGVTAWKLRVGLAEATRISREAAGWGTDVHALVELVNRNNRGALGPGAREIVQPYIDWYDANVAAVLGAERLCVSRKYGYAGTADGVVMLHGDREATILDLKTSRTPLGIPEWRLQLAAYALALAEEGIECRRRVIVRMPRAEPGKLYIHELPEEDLEIDQRCFLAVLRVFKWHADEEASRRPAGFRIGFGGTR